MCKSLGKRRKRLTAFLLAVIVFSAIFVAKCHAQVVPCATPVITSVVPSSWNAGQTIDVTITGTDFYTVDGWACWKAWVNVAEDTGSVAFSRVSVISASEIDAVVTVPSTVPTETACVEVMAFGPEIVRANGRVKANASSSVSCIGDSDLAAFPVQIVNNCTAPTVTSISPNVWFAGQTYNNVTITGNKFTNNDTATETCPVTTATITTPSGAAVALGAVTVNSPTQITIASVTPPASETTEGAIVALSVEASPQPNADVLEVPSITWTSDPDGSNPIIAGPNATLTNPSAVVGQWIHLNTAPSEATLEALPVFLTLTNSTWDVEGTNVGGYAPSPAATTPTATVLTNS